MLVKRFGSMSPSWVSSRTSSIADLFVEGGGGFIRVGWPGIVTRGLIVGRRWTDVVERMRSRCSERAAVLLSVLDMHLAASMR